MYKRFFFYPLLSLFCLIQLNQAYASPSIKFDPVRWGAGAKKEINGRTGPGLRYPIKYVYKTPFVPFKLLAYKDGWYYVQDFDEEKSWILGTLLTTKADVFLIKKPCLFYKKQNDTQHFAVIDRESILRIRRCSQNRCLGFIRSFEGWIEPEKCGWGSTPGLSNTNKTSQD